MDYKAIKTELQRRRNDTRYFTRDFYKLFLACQATRTAAAKNGSPDRYEKGNVILYHSFDPVYNSRFYQNNGGCYCEFLSVIA